MWILIAAALVAAPGGGRHRVAPMAVVSSGAPGALTVSAPRVADYVAADGRVVIESFLFKVGNATAAAPGPDATLRLTLPSGETRSFHARLTSGPEARFDARLPVAMAGEFRATLTVDGKDGRTPFEGVYTFGYPRYDHSEHLERVSTSASIRDDFESKSLDQGLWRVWTSDPGRVRMRQEGGRFWIDVTGPSGYNGLVSRVEMQTRDVEVVCRAGITSSPNAKHAALVHLCGSGPLSPDHWLEVQLRDADGKGGRAAVNVAVPREHRSGYRGTYDLPSPSRDGFLIRIVCDGATNICRGFALSSEPAENGPGEWWQLGDGFEVPARRTRLEIKTSGWAEAGGTSRIWFDDCRAYPRPQTHYVTVVLKRADRRSPGVPVGGGASQICFDAGNRRVEDCDLSVRLYAADGQRLIDEAHTGVGFGYALLKLDRSGWDLYPVPAILRVFANATQVGPDHVIRSSGVQGLYPDDVYAITLD